MTALGRPEASARETRWGSLTDEELLTVQWFTGDPLSLPGMQPRVPANLDDFEVELEYKLSPGEEVLCGHCPQHQKHRNGFVLRDNHGKRYLLGSTCGPKAYGADYRMASNARAKAHRRYGALVKWRTLRDSLQKEIEAFATEAATETTKAVRRMRAAMERKAPRTLSAIRGVRPWGVQSERRIVIISTARDKAQEEEANARFYRAAAALTEERLSNKEHSQRIRALKEDLGFGKEIMTTKEQDLGALTGAEWLIVPQCPAKRLSDATARLRALYAIGAVTDGRDVRMINSWSHETEKELAAALSAIEAISSAAAFFEPSHLAALAAWLSGQPRPPCTALAEGRTFTLYEPGGEAVVLGPLN